MSLFENGKLTYAGMRQVIDNGGVVLYDGEIIGEHERLPLPEQLAEDPEEKKAVAKTLDEQIAELQARRAAIVIDSPESEGSADVGFPLGNATGEPESDPSDMLPEDQLDVNDGYPANHKALIKMAKEKGFESKAPNPSRASLVEYLNSQK